MREMKDGWTLERYVEEAGLAAKWRKQGMEKGIVQGMERGIVQVARTMLKKRLPLEVIAEITGLTAEQLKRLERDDALYSRVE
jgi:predicted transposase/invertase (TIGR01784 family)